MALSALEQAYLDTLAGGGGVYWGTTLTGGYGSIAGGNTGGGKTGKANTEADQDVHPPHRGAIPIKDGKLPFDPKSYPYQHSVNEDGGPHFYYNNFYFEHGQKVPCDGWVWWEYPAPGEVYKLPACPTDQPSPKQPPLVCYYDGL